MARRAAAAGLLANARPTALPQLCENSAEMQESWAGKVDWTSPEHWLGGFT